MRAVVFSAALAAAVVACPQPSCGGNPTVWTPPAAFEAYVQFSIPYYNFTEKAYIWGSNFRNGGALRLSYNAGASIFIQNNISTNQAYQIFAAEQSLRCSAADFAGFNSPFPDTTQFCPMLDNNGCIMTQVVNGVPSYVFQFSFNDPQANPQSNSTFNPPNQDGPGYVGDYRWYQSVANGAPVRFHTVVGHNVVFGGSHVDEYMVDYIYFAQSQAWPEEAFFLPPSGMPCPSTGDPFGPTTHASVVAKNLKTFGREEPTDFHSLFPEGHARRRVIADAHSDAHSETLGGQPHDNHALARLHTSARYIHARNRALRMNGVNYTIGLNNLAHLTHAERRARSVGFRATAHKATKADFARVAAEGKGQTPLGQDQPADQCTMHTLSNGRIPDSIDNSMYSFPAKDQGTCGSCWSFGATGAIEGALWRTTGQAPSRASQQNLMDCSWYYGNAACDGGNDYTGFSFLLAQNQGQIATEASYGPYLNKNGFCHFDLSKNWTTPGIQSLSFGGCVHVNNGFQGTGPTDASLTPSLRDAMFTKRRPISVAIDATLPDFYYYTGGWFFDSACGNGLEDLDHQVLAVGYHLHSDGQYYTRIKNSWSNHWGDNGFVWISQNQNACGVATSPNYILGTSEVPSRH